MSNLCDKYEACYGDRKCANYLNCTVNAEYCRNKDGICLDVSENDREIILRQINEMIGPESCGGNSPCWSPECTWEATPQFVRMLEIIKEQLSG
jgi:hypothetical protein